MRIPERFDGHRPYRYIITSHHSRYLSGVARFNQMLAERIGAECIACEIDRPVIGPALFSVKLADGDAVLSASIVRCVERMQRDKVTFDVFFHSFDSLPAELRLLAACRHAFAGNAEIAQGIRTRGHAAESVWCPPLVEPELLVTRGRFTIFSFGMSHKIQTEQYRRLHEVLDDARIRAQLLVSTAFHEKANFGDIDAVERRLTEVFGENVHLLGFLSDAAVNHFLATCDLFCAFFPGGVRANNTTVAAAMCAGAPVLTNLDQWSPDWMRHRDTVLDLGRIRTGDLAPESLRPMAARGKTVAHARTSWARLLERLTLVADGHSRPALELPVADEGLSVALEALTTA